jgi:hypothetical protein
MDDAVTALASETMEVLEIRVCPNHKTRLGLFVIREWAQVAQTTTRKLLERSVTLPL